MEGLSLRQVQFCVYPPCVVTSTQKFWFWEEYVLFVTLKEQSKVKSETSHCPLDEEEGGVIESLVNKKKPSVQCEECYECFEDKEKLAWHNLNDH